MAGRIVGASKTDHRAVIQFLNAEGNTPVQIYRRMQDVYGEQCPSKTTVVEWCRKFSNGRQSTADLLRPGAPRHAKSDANVAAVRAAVVENRRVRVRELADRFDISVGTIHAVIHEAGYRKVCAQWIPRQLTEEHKANRMGLSLQHLQRYREEGDSFLHRIVAGDESWCHHYEPSSKRDSMQWKHPSSPRHQKFKTQSSAGKIMLTCFFDHRGPLLLEFKDPHVNINAVRYSETLTRLRTAIKNKRPGMLTEGVILLHDNARPHTANIITSQIARMRWEVLEHPPYSPDLSPCDFHVFGPLKKALKGQRFQSDAEVQQAVLTWFRQQPEEWYATGIQRLVKQWDTCLCSNGNFV